MAKVTIVGDVAVITSTQTLQSIKDLSKHRPKALKLFEKNEDGENNLMFEVMYTPYEACIGAYGVAFNSETRDDDKFACATVHIPRDVENAVEYVAETYGVVLARLNKVETQFEAALAEVAADKAAVMECITVM